jgi:hypothetical protein
VVFDNKQLCCFVRSFGCGQVHLVRQVLQLVAIVRVFRQGVLSAAFTEVRQVFPVYHDMLVNFLHQLPSSVFHQPGLCVDFVVVQWVCGFPEEGSKITVWQGTVFDRFLRRVVVAAFLARERSRVERLAASVRAQLG